MNATYDAGSVRSSAARLLARLVAGQHGVFSRAQSLACGFSPRGVDRRAASGVWDRLYPGVYRVAGSPATWRQSLMAACLAWGESAVVSHRAAAALWELPGFAPGVIELIVPRGRDRPYGERVHRPLSLPPADVTVIDGIPVTTPARTLIDVAGRTPIDLVEEALDDALRRKLVTVRRMRWRLEELGMTGRGRRVMGKLIAEREGVHAVPMSVFETRLFRVLRRAGLPKPVVQHSVKTAGGRFVLDFAYPDQRLAIEADGFRWHSSRQRWDHDRERANALIVLGWTIIRVTWTQLRDRPDEVAETIRVVLDGKR